MINSYDKKKVFGLYICKANNYLQLKSFFNEHSF